MPWQRRLVVRGRAATVVPGPALHLTASSGTTPKPPQCRPFNPVFIPVVTASTTVSTVPTVATSAAATPVAPPHLRHRGHNRMVLPPVV